MKTLGALLKSLPVKAMLELCSSIRRTGSGYGFPVAHLLWTWKGTSLLEFDTFFGDSGLRASNVQGDGLKRLEERQIWDVKYAECLT